MPTRLNEFPKTTPLSPARIARTAIPASDGRRGKGAGVDEPLDYHQHHPRPRRSPCSVLIGLLNGVQVRARQARVAKGERRDARRSVSRTQRSRAWDALQSVSVGCASVLEWRTYEFWVCERERVRGRKERGERANAAGVDHASARGDGSRGLCWPLQRTRSEKNGVSQHRRAATRRCHHVLRFNGQRGATVKDG